MLSKVLHILQAILYVILHFILLTMLSGIRCQLEFMEDKKGVTLV